MDRPTAYNLDKKYGTEASPITVAKNEAHARVIGLDAQEVTPSVVLSTYNITDTGESEQSVGCGLRGRVKGAGYQGRCDDDDRW